MKFHAVLFDLDGTLLDTLADIANSTNAVLARFGFPTHPTDSYRYFVGDGTDCLVRRVLPKDHLDEQTISKCLTAMQDEYSRRWAVVKPLRTNRYNKQRLALRQAQDKLIAERKR